MGVFISWSGTQSRKVASALREWLEQVVPGSNPWMSAEDIAPGTNWFSELMQHLEKTRFCVICLTPENMRSPWLYFEAGTIAGKRVDAKVSAYLIGVTPSQLEPGPLSQFQCTEASREGTWKLVRALNQSLEKDPHNEQVLEGNFGSRWPWLKKKIETALAEYDPDSPQSAIETEQLKPAYNLSEDAEQLLLEAALDRRGVLLLLRTMRGLTVQTNGKQLCERQDARSEATWQAAVRELLSNGLLENRGHKGEVFGVTAEGYRLADEIRSLETARP
jgi:hypothetical protein